MIYADDVNMLGWSVHTVKEIAEALVVTGNESGKSKGKAVPLQAWTGAEGLEKLTLNLPTTTIVAQPFNIIKWQLKFNLVA